MKDPNWRKCVLHADSRDIIKRIPDNSIDFILTDPPYNLGQHSTGNIPLPGRSAMNNDVAEWDMIDFNPEEWADEFIRILKPTGNLFIFTSYNQLGRWYNALDHRFDTSNFMIWHKTNPAPKIFKAGFLNSCEMIFTCWNKKHTWNFISQAEMHNFIESPICMKPERLSDPKHPAQKPISILKKMIEIASNKDDIIFDPFMGVGSTGVAALELGRRFIGVELDETYFNAAKKRVDEAIKTTFTAQQMLNQFAESMEEEGRSFMVCDDSAIAYQLTFPELDEFFQKKSEIIPTIENIPTGLQPIIKWPGGKEKELKYILPNMPEYKRFFEPFVGGGSVFMAMRAKEYYINDFSSELVSLYRSIAETDNDFFKYAEMMDASWVSSVIFFKANQILVDTYVRYRNEIISKEELKTFIHSFCNDKKHEILNIIGSEFASYSCVLLKEMETNLFRKMTRMRELEIEKHQLPDEDLLDNIETAIKSAVYMNYRHMYNDKKIAERNKPLQCALFFFMRNYAYSGMFRYSSKGEFNVPYGGIAYNSKLMTKKLNYYRSVPLHNHFADTHIYNLDFEAFLRETNPTEDDFVFLDPPYDSEFSTYAQNAFTKADQERLANYMINECRAKWMMIIKNTDFIYDLYNKEGINIRTFDKEYLVSFMNRNDKKVTHLLITNY
ncbi:MAG: DNA adenine methylase [Bacteroidales bacterium]|nr:DNA adenine methylase [Candidatus Liminaster caballi]